MSNFLSELSLTNISRDFRTGVFSSQQALSGVTAEIQPGSLVGLLGANGAGKSTLLRITAGWIPALTGQVRIAGSLLKPETGRTRRQVMLIDDNNRSELTPVEFLVHQINDYQTGREGIEDEVQDWFEKFELVGHYSQTLNQMSKGQQFKVALLSLFVIRPTVWLLDEPYSAGLDAVGIDFMESELKRHVANGGIVVFSSQWPQHAQRMASHVMVLHHGQLVHNARIGDEIAPNLMNTADLSLQSVLTGLVRRINE